MAGGKGEISPAKLWLPLSLRLAFVPESANIASSESEIRETLSRPVR
jgi:hypothetical protein